MTVLLNPQVVFDALPCLPLDHEVCYLRPSRSMVCLHVTPSPGGKYTYCKISTADPSEQLSALTKCGAA